MSYTKLANSILTSTIWMEDDQTRIVWFALMAMADKNGEVQASIPGLANVARVPVESCRAAIARFLSDDPDSRTKTDDGKRLAEIRGGWVLINHQEYRQLASDEDRKQKAAERQKRFRDRNARNKTVTPESRQIPQAEAEAEAEKGDPSPTPSKVPAVDFLKLTTECHKAFCSITGLVPNLMAAEGIWLALLKAGYTSDDVSTYLRWVRFQNAQQEDVKYRKRYSIPSMFSDIALFDSNLAQAKAWDRNRPKPPTPRETALRELRPVVCEQDGPDNIKTAADIMPELMQTVAAARR